MKHLNLLLSKVNLILSTGTHLAQVILEQYYFSFYLYRYIS